MKPLETPYFPGGSNKLCSVVGGELKRMNSLMYKARHLKLVLFY